MNKVGLRFFVNNQPFSTSIFNVLTISGFEKSILISLYLGAFKLVLKVKSVPSFVMYWRKETRAICITQMHTWSALTFP